MGYAGMGMQVAGQLMELAAAIGANKAMGGQYKKQIQEQSGYRNQATRALDPLIAGSTAEVARQQIGEGAAKREAGYDRVSQVPVSTDVMASRNTPQDTAYGQLMGQARGQYGGLSDWALRQSINNINAQRIMDNAINFAHGSANIFPLQMYEAQHSKDRLATAGKFVGSMGSAMGGMGGGGGGSSIPSAAPSFVGANGGNAAYASGYGQVPFGTSYDFYNNQNTYLPSFYR